MSLPYTLALVLLEFPVGDRLQCCQQDLSDRFRDHPLTRLRIILLAGSVQVNKFLPGVALVVNHVCVGKYFNKYFLFLGGTFFDEQVVVEELPIRSPTSSRLRVAIRSRGRGKNHDPTPLYAVLQGFYHPSEICQPAIFVDGKEIVQE